MNIRRQKAIRPLLVDRFSVELVSL